MYFIILLVLFVKTCEASSITIGLNNSQKCDNKYETFQSGDTVTIEITSPTFINFFESHPAFFWTTGPERPSEQTTVYYKKTTINHAIEELTGQWIFIIYRNKDANLISTHDILGHNYSKTICNITVTVEKRILTDPGTVYAIISFLGIAVLIIISETVFLILYIKKVKNLSSTAKYGLEDGADTVRYSKTPIQRKDESCDRDSNLYECLENIRTTDKDKLIGAKGPPLPPLPSPEVKMKLLASSSVNSVLEKPAKSFKGRPPLASPKMRPRIPSPPRHRCDSDGDETYEPSPDYRKSLKENIPVKLAHRDNCCVKPANPSCTSMAGTLSVCSTNRRPKPNSDTLPSNGLAPLDKKALIDALMKKKHPAPLPARPGHVQTNTIEKKVNNRPPLPVPAQHKHTELFQNPSSSKQNLTDPVKPIAKIPPPIPAVKIKAQNNIDSELATVLKRRRNVPEEQPKQVEPPKNLPVPSKSRPPIISKLENPPHPLKPSKKPKNVPMPTPVQDIPPEDPSDQNDDGEWTYEDLKQYNIYNI